MLSPNHKRLIIIQSYIPAYREAFFRRLRPALSDQGIALRVIAGEPDGTQAMRGDSARTPLADGAIEKRSLTIAHRSLTLRSLRNEVKTYAPNGIIVEQAIKNLETYLLLIRRRRSAQPQVALWGHGRTYSTQQGVLTAKFKDWITNQSDWFFAYTQEGADYLESHGYDRARISVLNNTLDTEELLGYLNEVSTDDVESFRREHSLVEGRTAVFMGGVDAVKGINFLLDSADRISAELEGFRLLIAGSGSEVPMVRSREAAGAPIIYLGRVDGREKALALKASDVMLIPQWVGLVAVDSLVAGRPIVTTRHPSHSPEFAYLNSGHNSIVVEHDSALYAAAVCALLEDRGLLTALQTQCIQDSASLSMEAMVSAFAIGCHAWLQESPL